MWFFFKHFTENSKKYTFATNICVLKIVKFVIHISLYLWKYILAKKAVQQSIDQSTASPRTPSVIFSFFSTYGWFLKKTTHFFWVLKYAFTYKIISSDRSTTIEIVKWRHILYLVIHIVLLLNRNVCSDILLF